MKLNGGDHERVIQAGVDRLVAEVLDAQHAEVRGESRR